MVGYWVWVVTGVRIWSSRDIVVEIIYFVLRVCSVLLDRVLDRFFIGFLFGMVNEIRFIFTWVRIFYEFLKDSSEFFRVCDFG